MDPHTNLCRTQRDQTVELLKEGCGSRAATPCLGSNRKLTRRPADLSSLNAIVPGLGENGTDFRSNFKDFINFTSLQSLDR